jgi:S-adenosylmethionine-diacylglycerol 3-amino-3-carboxypropyl transferase
VTELVFSRAWEDDRLDLAALAVQPGERVLVVAAAGDAALALAAAGASRVIAVDRNCAQLHLVALKIAAARHLDPETRYRWFEVGRDAAAPQLYRQMLRGELEPDASAYWDARIHLIADGLHDRVGVGRSFARVGRLARLLVPSLAAHVEAVGSTQEQAAFWRRHVRGRLFGPITHWLFAHTPAMARLAPNPHELQRMRRGGYSHALEARIEGVIERTLVREHPWWRPAFSGRAASPGHGAAWLDPDLDSAVRDGAERIELVVGDLTDALNALPQASLDAVSVSNVLDWLAQDRHRALHDALVRVLAPGGRALARSILTDDGSLAGNGLVRDPASANLVADERTALYGRVDLLRRD